MKFVPHSDPGEGSVRPDGEYPFVVSAAEEKQSKSSGNDMIEVVHEIQGGAPVYDYLVPGEDSEWKLINFLASIGEDVRKGMPMDLDPKRLIGRKGTCVLYTDTYQGKAKNKVADYVCVISGPGAQAPPPAKDKWR